MSDIIVKFKPSGHKGLVTAIKAIQKAQDDLQGVGKKYNVIVAKQTARVKALGTSWKKLGVSARTLSKATKGNRVALERLSLAMKKVKISNNGLLKSNRLIGSSFATMRSHMLLFQFGMALGIRQIINFTKEAAKVQQMERAFNTMSGGASEGADALQKLQNATNGTVSEMDLFQQANNAMVLGVTKNSDEMAEMFDMAQRLGDALGRDVKTSIESLVTGIGRQSRLMLDNIGIIVKADKAYADYALKIGKTADTLTDSQKKQAFMNAALEAGREKLQFLPEEVITANQAFQQLGASMSDAAVAIGEALLPLIVGLSKAFSALASVINPKRVKALAIVISVALVGALIAFRTQVKKAVLDQTKLGWGALATAAGFLAAEIIVLSGALNDQRVAIDETGAKVANYLDNLKKASLDDLQEQLKLANTELDNQKDVTKKLVVDIIDMDEATAGLNKSLGLTTVGVMKHNQQQKLFNTTIVDGTNANAEGAKAQEVVSEKTIEAIALAKENREEIERSIVIVSKGFESMEQYGESIDVVGRMYLKTNEAAIANNASNIAMVDSLIAAEIATENNAETLAKYAAVKAMLTEQEINLNNKLIASEQKVANAKIKTLSLVLKASADVIGMSEKNAKLVAGIQASAAIVDAYAAALSTKASTAKAGAPFPIPELAFAATLASGLVAARTIAMSANQIGGGSAPQFEQGGYVGGRRHSQGGTMIEAERGEFVMSRNAVESIGTETLNQMNQGGGGGNINVSVTGNVLTQDFVEGELAEAIKEAARRGSDFGLS